MEAGLQPASKKTGHSAVDLAQIISGVAAAIGLLLVASQMDQSSKTQSQVVYESVSSTWSDQLKMILENEKLIPYFFEQKPLQPGNTDFAMAALMADIRLEAMDRVFNATKQDDWSPVDKEGWVNVFQEAFNSSPFLCERFKKYSSHYSELPKEVNSSCRFNAFVGKS